MKIQHTPAPYASTILSLSNTEQFTARKGPLAYTVHAVTITPPTADLPASYVLSGETKRGQLRTSRMYILGEETNIPHVHVRDATTRTLAEYIRTYTAPASKPHLHAVPQTLRTGPSSSPTARKTHNR